MAKKKDEDEAHLCKTCGGSGSCNGCRGTGLKGYKNCSNCGADGYCPDCNGRGWTSY